MKRVNIDKKMVKEGLVVIDVAYVGCRKNIPHKVRVITDVVDASIKVAIAYL